MTGEELFDAARAEGAGERLPHDVVKRHFSIINRCKRRRLLALLETDHARH